MCECVFDNGNSCEALTRRRCAGCAFRKTEKELLAGREYAAELLDRLPREQRKAIEEKYYKRYR
jgi:hypothetical protein